MYEDAHVNDYYSKKIYTQEDCEIIKDRKDNELKELEEQFHNLENEFEIVIEHIKNDRKDLAMEYLKGMGRL